MQWIKKINTGCNGLKSSENKTKPLGLQFPVSKKLMATFAEKYDYLVQVSQIRNIYFETVIWLKK